MEDEVEIDAGDKIYDSEASSIETKLELDMEMLVKPYPARCSEEREIYKPGPKSKAKKRHKRAMVAKTEEERQADIIFKNGLIEDEMGALKEVIEGTPYTDSPRGRFKVTNYEPFNSDPGNDRQLLYKHEYYSMQARYRPLNKTAIRMLRKSVQDIEKFTPNNRKRYKMIAWQTIENLNYVSAKYAYKRINQENATNKIKEMMKNYYHQNLNSLHTRIPK